MAAISMFLIAASIVVNVHAWEMKSGIPHSLQIEENHTAHDLSGAEASAPFEFPKTFQKMDTYKHE